MRIQAAAFPFALPAQSKQEPAVNNEDANVANQQEKDPKQAIREQVQKQIAEMQAALTSNGDDDFRAKMLIDKFKSGVKLTPDELAYLRQFAPGMMDFVERVTRERDVAELSMRAAPTKSAVHIAAMSFMRQPSKHQNSDEVYARIMHLSNAHHEYMKTAEYKEKPNGPSDERKKSAVSQTRDSTFLLHNGIIAYQKAKQRVKVSF